MFNFRDAFGYLFKEKNWVLKFLIPLVINLLLVLPTVIFGLNDNSVNGFGQFGDFRSNYRMHSTLGDLSLLASCFALLITIPYTIVSLWYTYENTQSGIFNRKTTGIWENKFEDVIKKAGKHFVASFVYGLLIMLPLLIIAFVVIVAVFIFAIGIGGLNSAFASPDPAVAVSAILGFLLLACCCVILIVIGYVVSFLFITPALSRLIATNTLGEAMKFRENWKLGMKYKGRFLSLLGLTLIYLAIVGGASFVISMISTMLSSTSPLLGTLVEVVNQTIFAVITVYLGFFVYPRLTGQVFRSIIRDEESLSYIKLD